MVGGLEGYLTRVKFSWNAITRTHLSYCITAGIRACER